MRGHGQSPGGSGCGLLTANAWRSTVISVFAMVILSIIGSLFARNHHMVMGLDEDAEDHKAVASSIFITVAIYGVCHTAMCLRVSADKMPGLLRILWIASMVESKTKQKRRHLAAIKEFEGVVRLVNILCGRSSGSWVLFQHDFTVDRCQRKSCA